MESVESNRSVLILGWIEWWGVTDFQKNTIIPNIYFLSNLLYFHFHLFTSTVIPVTTSNKPSRSCFSCRLFNKGMPTFIYTWFWFKKNCSFKNLMTISQRLHSTMKLFECAHGLPEEAPWKPLQCSCRVRDMGETYWCSPARWLSRFSRVRLCATPQTAAHQAPQSLGFSRQEHWSGLPFPSPMHESEKWKGSRSVVSDSSRPHGLQHTRLLRPWDFPGKSTGGGCHHLLQYWRYNRLYPSRSYQASTLHIDAFLPSLFISNHLLIKKVGEHPKTKMQGCGEVNKMAPVTLSHPSFTLPTPCSVSRDCAWLCNGCAWLQHCACVPRGTAWLRATSCPTPT